MVCKSIDTYPSVRLKTKLFFSSNFLDQKLAHWRGQSALTAKSNEHRNQSST